MSKRLSFLVLVAIAVLAVGCGDDDESDGSASGGAATGSELSSEEFAERATPLCTQGKRRLLTSLVKYQEEQGGKASPTELTAGAAEDVVAPEIQDQIDELRDLGVPAEDGEQIEEFLVAMEEVVKAIEAGNVVTGQGLQQEFQQAGELARESGLGACAYG